MEQGPKIDLHVYGQLIFDKSSKTIEWIKESLQKMIQKQLNSNMQKEILSLYLTLHKHQKPGYSPINVKYYYHNGPNLESLLILLLCSNWYSGKK